MALGRRLKVDRQAVLRIFLFTVVLLLPARRQSSAQSERIPADLLTRTNPAASSDAVLASARKVYGENCLQCHGASGKGDGPMSGMYKDRPADLTNQKALAASTDGEIYWLITKGEKPMPSFEGKLSEEERWALVHLMRVMSNTKPNSAPRK
jgi:mono/diheme cytochrome c family protein